MSRFRAILVTLLFLLTTAFTGCVPETAVAAEYAPTDDKRLIIYTSHKTEVYEPLIREFEERTGIWVEIISGGTNELLEWIAEEQDAPRADLMFGGGVENLEAYKDCFLPYRSPELDLVESSFLSKDFSWTPFSANPIVLIYNTKLVDPAELTGWNDMFRESFLGSIAFADPAVSGSCFTALATYLLASDTDNAMLRFANALAGHQLEGSGAIITNVAKGSSLIGITIEEAALKAMRAGNDIYLVYPAEGTSCVPDGAAILQGCAHESNAKLFMDFIITADVQEYLERELCRRSVRVDVSASPDLIPLSQITQVVYSIESAVDDRDHLLAEWSFYVSEAKEGSE